MIMKVGEAIEAFLKIVEKYKGPGFYSAKKALIKYLKCGIDFAEINRSGYPKRTEYLFLPAMAWFIYTKNFKDVYNFLNVLLPPLLPNKDKIISRTINNIKKAKYFGTPEDYFNYKDYLNE